MTVVDSPAPPVLATARSVRPVWRSYGGGGLAAGGALLLFATVVEWTYLAQPAAGAGLLAAYLLPFVGALVILALATVPLAFGDSGASGVVGRSVLGRVALLGYGWFFLAAQFAYLFALYVADPAVDSGLASTVNLVFTVLQGVSAIVAAIVIARAGIATGIARWSMFVAVAVGLIAGTLSNVSHDIAVIMAGFCLSALSIVFVGATYLVQRSAPVRRRAA